MKVIVVRYKFKEDGAAFILFSQMIYYYGSVN